jgi:hypothetical protein
MNARIRRITTALGAGAILLASVSCGDLRTQGRSPSILIIDELQAASGAAPAELGGFLLSDVQTIVEGTPSIFNDIGQVTLRVTLKDVGNPGAPSAPSTLNAVTVTRYRVEYVRADGRNTLGVDVPYPIDGGVTATVTATPIDIPFEIVRHQAKEEAPLKAMVGNGGRGLISTIARVTFYGRDQVGNEVQTMGLISVNFGDFADPE